MYIVYDNKLYDSVDENDYYKIITRKQDKTDKDFYSKWEVYVKEIATTDSKIREIYKHELFDHRWQVNENHAYHYADIENNEVSIVLNGNSYSEDWVVVDRGFCSKIVDIYDCEKLLVRYTYSVRDGKALAEKEVVEVTMEPEAFKAEMLKYRLKNI